MIEDYFTQDIKIQRKVKIGDGFSFNNTKEWQTVLEIKGRIRTLKGEERVVASQNTVVSTHRLYCNVYNQPTLDSNFELDEEVQLDKLLNMLDEKFRTVCEGKTYDIKFCDNPMNMDKFLQIDLEYIGVLQDV